MKNNVVSIAKAVGLLVAAMIVGALGGVVGMLILRTYIEIMDRGLMP